MAWCAQPLFKVHFAIMHRRFLSICKIRFAADHSQTCFRFEGRVLDAFVWAGRCNQHPNLDWNSDSEFSSVLLHASRHRSSFVGTQLENFLVPNKCEIVVLWVAVLVQALPKWLVMFDHFETIQMKCFEVIFRNLIANRRLVIDNRLRSVSVQI